MSENSNLPPIRVPLVNQDGTTTNAFYKFFNSIANPVGGIIGGLAKILTSLGSTDGTADTIIDVVSSLRNKANSNIQITGKQSVAGGGDLTKSRQLYLVGDVDTPPALSFYGVLSAARKWVTFVPAANITLTPNDGAGTLGVDLADLTDSATGSFRLITRDAKGRLSGTKTGTAADVPYVNTTSGLTATDVQGAIDEVANGGGSSVNYAINGAFDVWQRGTSFSVSSVTSAADCWMGYCVSSSMVVTRQPALGSGLPDLARYFCRCTVTAGSGAAAVAQMILRVEDVRQFAGKKMSFALMARASIATTVGANLVQMYGNYAGAAMYGYGPLGRVAVTLVANVWTVIESIDIVMPALSIPHNPDPGSDGLQVSLWMNGGSNFNATGFVIGLNSGVYDWALVQVTDKASDFYRTEVDQELLRCFRYYEKSFPLEVAPAQNAGISGAQISPQCVVASLSTTLGHVAFKQSKMRIPTLVTYNPSAATAQPRNVNTSTNYTAVATTAASQDGFGVTATSPASSTAGQTAAFHWSADGSLNPVWNGVDPPVYPTLTLTGTYGPATIGTAYSSNLVIAGGNGVYSNQRVTVGTLPGWATLSIVAGNLQLSGTPTGSATTVSITVAVDSGDGQTATSAQSVVVSTGIVVTLNPADKASSLTLSSGNMIVTKGGTNGHCFVRATTGFSTGKIYWEVKMLAAMANDISISAFCLASVSNTGFVAVNTNGFAADWISGAGQVYTNGGVINTTSAAAVGIGDIIMIAYDVGGGNVWFGLNGTWLGNVFNGNLPTPDTGYNPAIYPSVATIPAGLKYPAINIYDVGGSAQAKFSAAQQTYAAPSGFSPVSI